MTFFDAQNGYYLFGVSTEDFDSRRLSVQLRAATDLAASRSSRCSPLRYCPSSNPLGRWEFGLYPARIFADVLDE